MSLDPRARARSEPQLDLDFQASQRARRSDPETSHAAARAAVGLAADHHAKILGSLITQGAGTIYELAERICLDHVAVARRLPELEARQVARPTQVTRQGPTGRQCRVWEAC